MCGVHTVRVPPRIYRHDFTVIGIFLQSEYICTLLVKLGGTMTDVAQG